MTINILQDIAARAFDKEHLAKGEETWCALARLSAINNNNNLFSEWAPDAKKINERRKCQEAFIHLWHLIAVHSRAASSLN